MERRRERKTGRGRTLHCEETAQNLNESIQVWLLLSFLTLNLLCQEAKSDSLTDLNSLPGFWPGKHLLSVTNKKIRKTLQEAVHPCRFRDLTLTKSSPKPEDLVAGVSTCRQTWQTDRRMRLHTHTHTHTKSFVSKTLQNGTIYWAFKKKKAREVKFSKKASSNEFSSVRTLTILRKGRCFQTGRESWALLRASEQSGGSWTESGHQTPSSNWFTNNCLTLDMSLDFSQLVYKMSTENHRWDQRTI